MDDWSNYAVALIHWRSVLVVVTDCYLDGDVFVDSVFGNRQKDVHHVKDASRLSDGHRPVVAFVDLREACKITRLHDTLSLHLQIPLNPLTHSST